MRFSVQGKDHYGPLTRLILLPSKWCPTFSACVATFGSCKHASCDAATQPLRRSSCLPCSLTEVLDPPPRRRANAGVSGEQMLDVTGSEDDSGTRGGGYATVARLHTASCRDSRRGRRMTLHMIFPPCLQLTNWRRQHAAATDARCSKPHLIPTGTVDTSCRGHVDAQLQQVHQSFRYVNIKRNFTSCIHTSP